MSPKLLAFLIFILCDRVVAVIAKLVLATADVDLVVYLVVEVLFAVEVVLFAVEVVLIAVLFVHSSGDNYIFQWLFQLWVMLLSLVVVAVLVISWLFLVSLILSFSLRCCGFHFGFCCVYPKLVVMVVAIGRCIFVCYWLLWSFPCFFFDLFLAVVLVVVAVMVTMVVVVNFVAVGCGHGFGRCHGRCDCCCGCRGYCLSLSWLWHGFHGLCIAGCSLLLLWWLWSHSSNLWLLVFVVLFIWSLPCVVVVVMPFFVSIFILRCYCSRLFSWL